MHSVCAEISCSIVDFDLLDVRSRFKSLVTPLELNEKMWPSPQQILAQKL